MTRSACRWRPEHGLPTGPLASRLRGAGGGPVDNPAPAVHHLTTAISCPNKRSHLRLGGCASVSVRKIDQAGQVSGPDGIRFYRPRAYVSVHEPFVISSKAYVAAGRLTPDGRFIVLTNVPAELRSRITTYDATAVVEATKVLVDPSRAVGGSVQSGDLPGKAKIETLIADGEKSKPGSGAGPPAKTGQLNLRVSNDNKAYAFQPTRRYFDILFLPDFEEEYIVSAESRLGNASAEVALGQGWSLQGMAMLADNDALNQRIFALMDDAQKILTAAARTAAGIPPLPGGPQAGKLKPADEAFKGGTAVSVKVSVVRVVAPGLYKVLKPKELAAFNSMTAAATDPDFKDRVLVPIAPLSDISFNTYEVLVFEAVPVVGDSPLRMHQTVDGSMGSTGGGRQTSTPPADLKSQQEQVNIFLDSSGADARASLTLSSDGSTILLRLTPTTAKPLTPDAKAKILRDVQESLKGTGKNVVLEP